MTYTNRLLMTRKKIEHYLIESYPDSYEDILLADGFDEAFLGVVESNGSELKACYDFYRCIDILIADGAEDYESALRE